MWHSLLDDLDLSCEYFLHNINRESGFVCATRTTLEPTAHRFTNYRYTLDGIVGNRDLFVAIVSAVHRC